MTTDPLPPIWAIVNTTTEKLEREAKTKELHEILDNAAVMIETWANQFKLRNMWQYVRALAECSAMLRQAAIANRPPAPEPQAKTEKAEVEKKEAEEATQRLLAEQSKRYADRFESLINQVMKMMTRITALDGRIAAMEKPTGTAPKRKRSKKRA